MLGVGPWHQCYCVWTTYICSAFEWQDATRANSASCAFTSPDEADCKTMRLFCQIRNTAHMYTLLSNAVCLYGINVYLTTHIYRSIAVRTGPTGSEVGSQERKPAHACAKHAAHASAPSQALAILLPTLCIGDFPNTSYAHILKFTALAEHEISSCLPMQRDLTSWLICLPTMYCFTDLCVNPVKVAAQDWVTQQHREQASPCNIPAKVHYYP